MAHKGKKIQNKKISPERYQGHVECCFDNLAEKKFPRRLILFNSRLVNDSYKRTFFRKKCFTSKSSSAHVENSFNNPVEKFLIKSRKFSDQYPKMVMKFFLKVFFWKWSSGQVEGTLEKTARKFFTKRQIFSSFVQKLLEEHYFSKRFSP